MTRIKLDLDIDNIVQLYNSGKSTTEIANAFGVSRKPIARILASQGVTIRRPNALKALPVTEIIGLYQSGLSINELARRFNVADTVITRRLKEAHVVMRTSAEANKLMMAHRTPEENARNVAAAHNAIRGKSYTHEEACHRAACREHSFSFARLTSPYERAIAEELLARKIHFVPQKAIDKYNVDFAVFDNIALEVFGGGWHSSGRHKRVFDERSKKIFDCGYTLVICWVGFHYEFLPAVIVDYLVSLNDILCSDPTAGCKHYVIRCDGNTTTIGGSDLDYIT